MRDAKNVLKTLRELDRAKKLTENITRKNIEKQAKNKKRTTLIV